jgi:ABC-2 type transport system ATP-binding protein
MMEAAPAGYFNLPGISNLAVSDKSVSFIFNGDINIIIAKLYERKIANLIVEEPSLEEIFMHYYEKEA